MAAPMQNASGIIQTRYGPISAGLVTTLIPTDRDGVTRTRDWMAYVVNKAVWSTNPPDEVWMDGTYLVQVYRMADEYERLSIMRVDRSEISEKWDVLQSIKADIVGAGSLAVEVYPPAPMVVDVAPMRHLWIIPDQIKGDRVMWPLIDARRLLWQKGEIRRYR